MSDPTPTRTPSNVERMTNSTSRSSAPGFGGMISGLLVVACLVLIGACFYINTAKNEAKATVEKQMVEINNLTRSADEANSKLLTANRDISTFRAELDRRIQLSQLPTAVQAPTVREVIAKIQALADAPKVADGSKGSGPTLVAPSNDSPTAWMETIAKQVAKASIKTNEPTGNDAAKIQLNKGIQIVLSRIGAFPKQPTGASQDTFDAVVAFQKANKLTPDGIIGKGTWGKVREKFEATAHAGQ
jgi:hypothetical protein